MDEQRFQTLALAYGGDLRRWPEADRAGAEAFRAMSPRAQAVLDEAGALDFALDAWRPPVPTATLRDRILASAPAPRARAAWKGIGLWLSGAGFAAAAAAGVAFGLAATNAMVSDAQADAVLSATLPGEVNVLAPFTVGDGGNRPA